MDYNKAALEMHESHHGKVGIVSKVEVKTRDDLSTAYTPGVAEPCRKIKENPDDVYKYTFKSNMVAVVSNGTAVLGLGDIGPEAGLPVMEGKAVLFKEFGGVDAFPICIDAHDAASVIAACKAIAPTFGGINLEDIKSPECFEIEETLERELDIPVFHDDQHGTAIVVSAGLLNALRLVGKKMEDVNIVINGAGSAGISIAKLLLQFGVGAAAGVALGYLTRKLLDFYRRIGGRSANEDAGQATAMSSILVIAMVFLTYALTTDFGGNGYLAVYICGIVLGNSTLPHRRSISKFMDGLTWLAQIVVFIMLGLLVNPREMLSVAAVSTLIGAFMILVGRPASVFLCLLPFRHISLKAKTFVSWVGLRGAVPIIFATYPVVADVPGASQIFNIVFFVTLLSLVVQGTTVIGAARKLKLEELSRLCLLYTSDAADD